MHKTLFVYILKNDEQCQINIVFSIPLEFHFENAIHSSIEAVLAPLIDGLLFRSML